MKAGAKKAFVRTTGAVALGASSMSLAFPALAFASEEESGGISAILPNMTEFIPMLVCFIILVVVLGKLGWPKFAGMLEKRERTIKESLEKSEAARIESERLLEEYKRQLEEAKSQAAQIVADAKKTGEAVKADMTEKAQAESAAMIEKARAAIEAEKKAAISEPAGFGGRSLHFGRVARHRERSQRRRTPQDRGALRERGGQFQCQLTDS